MANSRVKSVQYQTLKKVTQTVVFVTQSVENASVTLIAFKDTLKDSNGGNVKSDSKGLID